MSEEQNNDQKKSVNDLQNDNGLEKEKKDFLKEVDGEKNISSKNMRNNKKNGRNNGKRRERHELPPNVDNLPPLSLQDMQIIPQQRNISKKVNMI